MGTLEKLVEVLLQQQLLPEGSLLQARLPDAEVQEGLVKLQALVKLGLDVEASNKQWSKQQVDCGLAIVEAVLCASHDWIAGRISILMCIVGIGHRLGIGRLGIGIEWRH